MTRYTKPKVKQSMKKARKIIGKAKLAGILGISYQSMDRWGDSMPCTEYNGKTLYAYKIQALTNGEVTITDLLGFIPHPQQWAMDDAASAA